MENYILIQNKINEIIDKIKELEQEDDRLIRYTNKRLSFYNRAYEMYLQMLRLSETVDKMVKDSQTIDEEIKQQDTLKKEGNTFITLEAEGETLVNVCDQEEPVAITKGYTVENSGNHVPLQGEFDGKCRPVIQGNTMVNLANGGNTQYNERTWTTAYLLNNIKENTDYTIIFELLNVENNDNINQFYCSIENNVNSQLSETTFENGVHVVKLRTRASNDTNIPLDTNNPIYFYGWIPNKTESSYSIRNVMIFEGDLTQTPELIPTEYVDGLKSSFEDQLTEDGKYKVEYKVTGENKEYTKTFYLNSPLLEGDTIEDVNGKATHVKRYGKVVLDGSENWWFTGVNYNNINSFCTNTILDSDGINDRIFYCDKLSLPTNKNANQDALTKYNQIHCHRHSSYSKYVYISYENTDINNFKQWLQDNPVTLVYQLASPIKETISEESILCDSYANGHLDFDSVVPIGKVDFKHFDASLLYSKSETVYTVQFEADNVGILYNLDVSGGKIQNANITKGLNKFILTTPSTLLYNWFTMNGIGFNASNIVVTESDVDFKYFKGIESSCEDNALILRTSDGVKESEITVQLNSPLLKGDRIEVIDGKMYHYHKMCKVVLNGSENWERYVGGLQDLDLTMAFTLTVNDMKDNWANYTRMVADIIPTIGQQIWSNDIEGLASDANSKLIIRIKRDRLSNQDMNGFKQWLQAIPTTVVYELAEPWYEEIEMPLYIKGVGKNIEIDTGNINLSNINIKY